MQKIPSSFVEQSTHINSFLSKMHTKILEYPFKLDIPPPLLLVWVTDCACVQGPGDPCWTLGTYTSVRPPFFEVFIFPYNIENRPGYLYHCGCFPPSSRLFFSRPPLIRSAWVYASPCTTLLASCLICNLVIHVFYLITIMWLVINRMQESVLIYFQFLRTVLVHFWMKLAYSK